MLHQVLAASHQEYLDSLKSREGGERPPFCRSCALTFYLGEAEGGTEPTVDTPEDQNTN